MTQTLASTPDEIVAGSWVPPQDVKEHSDAPIPPDADFFAAPPAEIGKVQSAQTSLKHGKSPWAMPMRFALAATVGAVLGGGLYYVLTNAARRPSDPEWFMLAGLVFALGFTVAWLSTGFKQTCSYVGEEGVARYTAKGSRENLAKLEYLHFADAAEVRTAQTRHYYNGVYTGTSYAFTWTDPAGRRLLKLSGQHRGKKGRPKPSDPFHFAEAAEIAWSTYLLGTLDAQLAAQGYLQFNIKPGQFVRVGRGFFEFCLRDEVQKITREEIKSVNLSSGHFHIATKDAKWFGRSGKFSFNYANMANARLFLLAMDKLVGYRFG